MPVYYIIIFSRATKPLVKKNKKPHVHRKNKLAILSYYKVEGDDVVRLRQQCKICPPGIIYL